MSEPQSTEATNNADGQQDAAATQTTEAPETGKSTLSSDPSPAEGEDQQTGSEPEAPSEGEAPKDTSRGAPEEYRFTNPKDMPEGSEIDQEVLASFSEVARELDLSQDAAQNVIDKVMPKLFERAEAQQAEVVKQWQKQVETDPEIGGDNLSSSLEAAKTALQKLGTPELRQLLEGPIGNHPELVRFVVNVGRQVSEDMTGKSTKGVLQDIPSGEIDINDDAALAQKFYGRS